MMVSTLSPGVILAQWVGLYQPPHTNNQKSSPGSRQLNNGTHWIRLTIIEFFQLASKSIHLAWSQRPQKGRQLALAEQWVRHGICPVRAWWACWWHQWKLSDYAVWEWELGRLFLFGHLKLQHLRKANKASSCYSCQTRLVGSKFFNSIGVELFLQENISKDLIT